jgi:hypothetical protein
MLSKVPIEAIDREIELAVRIPFDVEPLFVEGPVACPGGEFVPREASRLIEPEAVGIGIGKISEFGEFARTDPRTEIVGNRMDSFAHAASLMVLGLIADRCAPRRVLAQSRPLAREVSREWSAIVATNNRLTSSFQYSPRLQEVRPINHPAPDGQHTCAGICFECGDNFLSVADITRRGREGRIDDLNLGRMDCELAGETIPSRGLGLAAEPLFVAEIGEHAVDRLNARCDSPRKTK